MKWIDNWNTAKSRRITRRCIGAVILMLIVYTVICYVIIDNYSNAPKESLANEETNFSNSIVAEDNILPVPASDASVDWECGTYYSNISKSSMQEYLTKLAGAGWKDFEGKDIATEVMNGTTGYDLRYKDHILQLITYLVDTENAICNSILVYYDEELSYEDMMSRIGTIDKPEALSLIQTQVKELSQQGKIPDTKDIVTGLFELPVKNAYEKMQVQAFAAISDMGFTGCFLIRKGVASYVPGNLSSAQVTDIDRDGSYELLNSYDRYEANTYCLELAAYRYEIPDNNSLSELAVEKYHTCYVPKKGYEQFQLVMEEQGRLLLMGEDGSYGTITVEEGMLCIQGERASELLSWSSAFDQSNLKTLRKIDPSEPSDITISLEEKELGYVIWKTNWMGTEQEYSAVQILELIKQSKIEIPTVYVGSFYEEESAQRISIDFGESMPDSIQVFDAMLEESGSPRYQLDYEQAVQIMSDSRVEFPLSQHMAYYLSSDTRDYDRDWKRLFRVVCTWGEKQCTYAFVINTGEKRRFNSLSSIHKLDFLECEGSYSALSSS